MKTKLLFIILQICCGILLKGQEKKYVDSTQHIIYDFRAQKYERDIHRIKVHTPVVFKIKNINPFVYKVTITSKDSIVASSDYDANFYSLLNRKQIQEAEGKLLSESAAATKNLSINAAQVDKNDAKGEGKELKKNQETIVGLNKIRELDAANKLLKKEKEDLETNLKEVLKNAVELDSTITNAGVNKPAVDPKSNIAWNDINKKITHIQNKIDQNIAEIEKQRSENTKEYQYLLDDFNNKYNSFMSDCRNNFKLLNITKQLETVARIPSLTDTGFKQYETEINMASDLLLNGIKDMNDYKKSYSELNASYFKLVSMNNLDRIMETSGVEKILSYPKFLKEKSDQLNNWFMLNNFEDVIKQAFLISTDLKNVENYSIRSNPIQPENDMVEFRVKIEPWDKKSSTKDAKPKEFIYRQAIYGGTRVDLSLGLAAARYKATEDYTIGADSIITIKETNLLAPSLVGMVTMSYRKTNYVSYGGSFGMGVDVSDGKIQLTNFFIGPTVLFGKKQRILVSVGPSVKNVGRLKNEYIGRVITPTGDLSSYIKNYYKIGMFAAITYSLTKDARALIKNLR